MISILLDLGGTHLRLALLKDSQIETMEVFDSPQSKEELLQRIIDFYHQHPSATHLFGSIAGPIENSPSDQIVQLTNLHFSLSKTELEKLTHLQIQFINDLHALATSIPLIPKEQMECLIQEKGNSSPKAKKGIISCGTGLGVAFLTEGTTSFPSEAGHIEFAPTNDLEWELFQFMKKKFPHVSYERVLSGSSQNFYLDFFKKQKTEFDPDLIWWQIFGKFSSSVALMNLCEGGIYLGGGYLRSKIKNVSKYKEPFESSFFDKGRLSHTLKMGVFILLDPNPEILGLERLALR